MKKEIYFIFKPTHGSSPIFEFVGGTKCLSQMSELNTVEQRLEFVHQHLEVQLSDKKIESKKNINTAKDKLKKAQNCKDPCEGLKLLHQAMVNVPQDDSETLQEIDSVYKNIMKKLNLSDRDQGSDEQQKQSKISEKMKVVYKEGVGRHVIATDDIEAGELIVSECPGSSFLHHSHSLTNCHHCLKSVIRAVPCIKCSQVMFCSDTCRDSARVYHDRECGHVDIVPGAGSLAPVLRLVTSHTPAFFRERREYFDKYDNTSESLNTCDMFHRVFSLQAGNKTDSQYITSKTAHACYLILTLKKMNYFSVNDEDILDDDHLIVGRFIEHFLRVADDNCHEICEVDTIRNISGKSFDELFDSSEEDGVVRVVGVGIYPTLSLFNNSCDVNTTKYHDGVREIMLARRNIRAGEEISDFYGEYYFQNSKLTRKKNLGILKTFDI